jgi:Protein of unknown function (DUF2510)
MSGQIIATINLSLGLVALLVGASMLLGAFDIIRQPGRVWQQAGESKPAYLILVLLIPIVGLALYAFMARPKLVALAAAGPTAAQPSAPPDAGVDEIRHQDDRAATTPEPLGSENPAQVVGPYGEPVVKEATPSAQSGPVEISSTFFSNKGSRTARARRGLVLSRHPKQRAGVAVEDTTEQVEDSVEVPTASDSKGSRTARSRLGLILSHRLSLRPKQRASVAVEDSVEDVEQVEDNVEANEVPTDFSNKSSRPARSRLGLTLSHRPKQRASVAVDDSVDEVEQVEDNVEANEVPTDFSNKSSRPARSRRGLTLSRRSKQRASLAVEDSVEDVEQVEDNVEANEVPTDFSNKGSRRARSRLGLILSHNLSFRPKQRASVAVADRVEDVKQVEDNVEANEVPTAPAGWKTDPSGRHQIRYWDGSHWTEHVADADNQATGDQPSHDQPSDDQTSDDNTEESAGSRPRTRSRRLAVPYRR